MSALDAILGRLAVKDKELDGRVSELERLEYFSSGGLPGLAHMLLDGGTVHTDTAVASPLRGAIIVGNASPVWDALPLGVSATFLRSNGTDASWSAIQESDLPATMATDAEVTAAIAAHAALPNVHHAQSHVLATISALGPDHTVSGLTSGQVLKATGATTALFVQLLHSELGSVGANDHHNQSHVLATTSALGPDHTVSGLTAGQVLRATGAATAAFGALQATDLAVHVLASTSGLGSQHSVSGLTAGQFLRATGATTAAFEAIQAGDLPSHTHDHSTLTNVTANQHHNQSHVLASTSALGADHTVAGLTAGFVLVATGATTAVFAQLLHSQLGSIGANDHHAQSHVLATTSALGADHTVSGLTSGQVLKATGATAARFIQLLHSELGSIGANDHHNQSHVLASTSGLGADHTVSGLTSGQVLRATGATTAAFGALQAADLAVHVLATTSGLGSQHSVSGLTARQVLIATGATTALFRAIEDADLPSTIVRTSRTLSVSGLGLSGLGDLSANRTITLTSSSNPGAAAAILATNASGVLTLYQMVATSRVYISNEQRVVFRTPGGADSGSIRASSDNDLVLRLETNLRSVLFSVLDGSGAEKTHSFNSSGAGIPGSVQYEGNLRSTKSAVTYDVYAYHPLTTPLTSTSWDGDAKTTANNGTIDLSAVFGLPAAATAVSVMFAIKAAAADVYAGLGPDATDFDNVVTRTQVANIWSYNSGVVSLTGGDLVFVCGGNLTGVYIKIYGYWI